MFKKKKKTVWEKLLTKQNAKIDIFKKVWLSYY